MAGGELSAVFKGLAEDADQAAGNIAESVAKIGEQTADNEEANLARTLDAEARNAKSFTDIAEGDGGLPEPAGAAPRAGGAGEPGVGEPDGVGSGQHAEGNGTAETGGTDPVDVVSGQLLISVLDLALPGVLALVLRRAYASGYSAGGLFGTGWSSTVDTRLVVGADGVRFLGDDAQTLEYRTPTPGTRELPRHGARWPLTVDPTRGEYRVEDPEEGLTWHFHANETGGWPLVRVHDRNGNEVILVRDETGRPVEVAHSGGYRVAIATADGPAGTRLTGLRLLDGGAGVELLAFGYDHAGRLTDVTDSSGVPYRYRWDEQDRITGWVDRNGGRYHYTYDSAGRVVETGGDGGLLAATLDYDTERRVTTVTDGLGNATAYHYDRFGHVTRTIDPLGGVVRTDHDRYGRLLARTDQLGRTTTIERDEFGSPLRLRRPDGSELSFEYNSLHQPVRVTGPDGAAWQYGYDTRGNLLTTIDPLGAGTSFGYDHRGALVAMTDPLGGSTRFEVDAVGLPVAAVDVRGTVTRAARDAFGRVAVLTDPLGAVTRTGWSVEGRPLWRRAPDGGVQRWFYDPAGNPLRSVDGAGAVTRFEYGPLNTVTARIEPTGARYAFTYDTRLCLTTVTGPTGLTWEYTVDAAGRVVAERDFDGRVLRYRLDPTGLPVERVNGVGQTITYVRDDVGRVVERHQDDAVHRYVYDANGGLARAESTDAELVCVRDAVGRPLSETVAGRTVRYAYDALGNTVLRRTPTGAESNWTFDELGLPRALTTPLGNLSFAFDPAGREIRRGLGDRVAVSQSFDVAGRLATQSVDVGSATVQRRSYAYRLDGAPTEIHDLMRGSRTLALDVAGRTVAVTAANWSERYAYDALGNLAQADFPAATEEAGATRGQREHSGTLVRRAGRVRYEHDAQGRLVRRIRRTLSGQVHTDSYHWDADDRLIRAVLPDGTAWTYHYDPLGRRVAKRHLDADGAVVDEVRFAWDGTRLAEQEHLDSGGRTTVLTWDWEPGGHRPVAQSRRSWATNAPQRLIDARFWSIVTDGSGTPHELVGADGRIDWYRTASLWGETVSETGDGPALRFPGQYYDAETGFHQNLHRYYDPAVAGYTSADPLGLRPQPNHHAYVGNPFRWQDPTGLAGGPINWNWKSVKTFGHTFSRHGAGMQNTRNLAGRAATEGTPQGQWLNNDQAAEFLKNQYDPAKTEPWEVDLPPGMGQLVNADGTTVPASRARLVPNNRGVYRSAFPIPGENTCPSA